MVDALHDIPLFEGISDDEYQWLLANSREMMLERGTVFFNENDMPHQFYIVLEGELQVTRTNQGGTMVLGTTPRGIIGGELALLNSGVYLVTSTAIMPTRLMVFDEPAFRTLFGACPVVGTRILRIAAERMSGYAARLTQQEKMAALGKLSAGLAHELNNPAAGARRAARTLHDALPGLQEQSIRLGTLGLNEVQVKSLLALQRDAIANAGNRSPLSPLERADQEDAIGEWLEDQAIADAWECAAAFVTAGVTLDDLQALVGQLPPDSGSVIIPWLSSALTFGSLLDEIEQGTSRISDLVGAVKEYTYMDQAPVQEVDLHRGLDNTLRILAHKLRNIEVIREYDPDMPRIMARGSELNQVWTNLIDNAIDAMNGTGTLRLITRCENNFAMVEVRDSGSGIPPDVLPHLFEPFYTTKEVGKGTGMGLDISYRIIQNHNASIDVQSKPGETRFIVRIPLNGKLD
jgi:signal transduction histidine kinase